MDEQDPGGIDPSPIVKQVGPSSLAWLEAGSGPPVVFLHGLGGTASVWVPQLEQLSTAFRCVAWDMPGYGRSSVDALGGRALSYRAIGDAIVALMGDLGVSSANIVGLSFGGQQALHLAIDHPDRVDRLVLADTSAAFGADGTDPQTWKRLRLDPLDRGLQPADMAEAVIDAISGPDFAGPERTRAIEAFSRISADGLRAAVHCLPTHDVTDRLAEVRAETLVIVGELDTETPPDYGRVLADGITDAELSIMPGVGHLTPSEDPATFNALIARFLSRVG